MIRWLLTALLLLTFPARAAELTVLSAGAVSGIAKTLAPTLLLPPGDTVVIRSDTVGALVSRILEGEPFDVVLISYAGLARVSRAGKLISLSEAKLARVGVGVGVKTGAAIPDITSVSAFRATMLNARAVAYVDPASGGSSGVYVAKLFQTLGIAEAMAPKTVLVNGGLAAEALLDRRADIALQQTSEILAVPGVTLVGPLPAEIQNETIYFGAIAAGSYHRDAAKAFLTLISGPAAAPLLAARGMLPP
jgi:molybdate transport system substrate-binding protein